MCHPLWAQRRLSLVNPPNASAVRCSGRFDSAAAANEMVLALLIALYGGLQAVCQNKDCSEVMREAMALMSSAKHSAWSV